MIILANNLPAILQAVDLFFDVMYTGNLNAGDPSKYVVPMASGEGHYTFVRGAGLNYWNDMRFQFVDGSFTATGMGAYGGYTVTNSGEFATISWYSGSGNSQLRFSDTAGFMLVGSDYNNSPISVSRYINYEQGNRFQTTLAFDYPKSAESISIGSNSDNFPVTTNIQNLSGRINSLYIPLIPGKQYTYQDAADIVVDAVNLKYPDLNITVEDLPPESNYLPTEPTEPPTVPGDTLPSGGGFVFDYNEVISPSELETILDQETYAIDTVQSLDLVSLEMPELDTLPQDMVVAAGSLMTAITPVFTETGLLAIFLPLAIVMILIIFLRGR